MKPALPCLTLAALLTAPLAAKPAAPPSPRAPLPAATPTLLMTRARPAFTAAEQQSLAARLAAYTAQFNMDGAAAAIVQGDRLLWSAGVGTANPLTNLPLTADTPHLSASISKTVTAAVLMRLTEQRLLSLDSDISTILGFPVRHPAYPDIPLTCRQLLSHRGSLTDTQLSLLPTEELYTFGADHAESLESFCRSLFLPSGSRYLAATYGPDAPGTRFEYSNLGIALAGLVAEKAAGVPFDELSQRLILRPLGMTRSGWRLADFDPATLAMPLNAAGAAYGHYTFPDYPDGGLYTSVNDYSRFLRAIMNGGSLSRTRILQPYTVRQMLTPHRTGYPEDAAPLTGYSLGWSHYAFDGIHPLVIGHAGGEQGVNTLMAFNPATLTGAVVFLHKDFQDRGPATESLAPLLSDFMLAAENLQPLSVREQRRRLAQVSAADRFLTTRQQEGFSGQVFVSLKGRPLLSKGYGEADLGTAAPITPRTRFAIGSITKTFTATAIAILADRGEIDLDHPMVNYLPGTPAEWPAAWQAITVRHLLLHTSGLGDYVEQGAALGVDPRLPLTPEQIIGLFRDVPLTSPPGTTHSYSNSGMFLLGAIITKVSGLSYQVFVEQEILDPLELNDTGFDVPAAAGQEAHAMGYNWSEEGPATPALPFDTSITWSAGALHSTGADLDRWARAQRPGQLVSPAAWEVIQSSQVDASGGIPEAGFFKQLIWFTGNIDGRPVFTHDGSIDGFAASLIALPEEQLTIAILQNNTTTDPNAIAAGLAGLIVP